MNALRVATFDKGLITNVEKQSVPRGSAVSALNWLSLADRIELRRGYKILGTDAGSGIVTGLHVALKSDATEILLRTRGKKLEYYDTVTLDWIEIGTDQLGADADGEEVSFANYNSLAGYQVWLNSPNSSLYKIMTANIASIVDQYDDSKNYKGLINIKQNRMFLWGTPKDKTGLYGSYIDSATYTTATAESFATGDGTTKTFAETLDFKAGGAKRTCFGVTLTDSVETFTDNYDGTLTGSAGGTGTVNYATGAVSITFNAAPANLAAITATYQWEDSTNNGIADFTYSSTRLAGEGFNFRQDDGGGDLKNVLSFQDTEYCLHKKKSWVLTLTNDDTNANNLLYREGIGITNWRAAVATGEGIYYIDDVDEAKPKFRLLSLDTGSSEVIPQERSSLLDLSGFYFDKAAAIEWGDYILFACRTIDSDVNNRVFAYNKTWKCWDLLEYFVSTFAVYNGALVAGDSLTNNVYELFSGFDDDDSLVNNYWESGEDMLDIEALKKCKKLWLRGLIQRDQEIKVSIELDNSGFVEVGTIEGGGDYVDAGQSINVGAVTVGKKEIGGGSTATAFNFYYEIHINTDKFEDIRVRFEATGIGYAAISSFQFQDIRRKEHKLNRKYR